MQRSCRPPPHFRAGLARKQHEVCDPGLTEGIFVLLGRATTAPIMPSWAAAAVKAAVPTKRRRRSMSLDVLILSMTSLQVSMVGQERVAWGWEATRSTPVRLGGRGCASRQICQCTSGKRHIRPSRGAAWRKAGPGSAAERLTLAKQGYRSIDSTKGREGPCAR